MDSAGSTWSSFVFSLVKFTPFWSFWNQEQSPSLMLSQSASWAPSSNARGKIREVARTAENCVRWPLHQWRLKMKGKRTDGAKNLIPRGWRANNLELVIACYCLLAGLHLLDKSTSPSRPDKTAPHRYFWQCICMKFNLARYEWVWISLMYLHRVTKSMRRRKKGGFPWSCTIDL